MTPEETAAALVESVTEKIQGIETDLAAGRLAAEADKPELVQAIYTAQVAVHALHAGALLDLRDAVDAAFNIQRRSGGNEQKPPPEPPPEPEEP